MRASGQRWRRIATLQQGRPEKAANLPVIPTQSEAAQLLNVFERTVRSATVVRDKGTPALQKAVEQGHLLARTAAADRPGSGSRPRRALDWARAARIGTQCCRHSFWSCCEHGASPLLNFPRVLCRIARGHSAGWFRPRGSQHGARGRADNLGTAITDYGSRPEGNRGR
jgi:hypothetical protein